MHNDIYDDNDAQGTVEINHMVTILYVEVQM